MKQLLLIIFTLLSFTISYSQVTRVEFTYDARGNRTGRQIVMAAQRIDNSVQSHDTNVVSSEMANAKVLIYPNPVLEKVTVNIQIPPIENNNVIPNPIMGSIEVLNSIGLKVGESKIVDGIGTYNFEQQATGAYILRITYNNEHIDWKVLKQ